MPVKFLSKNSIQKKVVIIITIIVTINLIWIQSLIINLRCIRK